MAFRADEAAAETRRHELWWRRTSLPAAERDACQEKLVALIDEYGPVVGSYPVWHPVLARPGQLSDYGCPVTRPEAAGLDHCIWLRRGFISCPYHGADDLIADIEAKHRYHRERGWRMGFHLMAETLDFPLWNPKTTTVLVHWKLPGDAAEPEEAAVEENRADYHRAVIGFMVEWLAANRRGSVAESWESMSGYLLGTPNGKRSSLFVDEKTGAAMKKIYEGLVASGMFGPPKAQA